ncbi:hypothetical protein LTR85_011870 [Meristemomyces frigidus]|nr:hypothetical protein LTR85_011870 [Meristemomyces frigidus]
MTPTDIKQLHWTQRLALVRHNLHTASRSGDFSFFKAVQAAGFIEGTNHAATLSAAIGDDADAVLAAMDNLNAGLAHVHQDAFKTVFDNLKDSMREENKEADKSKLYVDITMQKTMADMAIDKMSSSAIGLISQQPEEVQDTAANVWITGATIVADALEVSLREMESLEYKMEDFIRLEESWNTVKASVVCSVMGLKGVFSLMNPSNIQAPEKVSPRSASIASSTSAIFRRMSNAFASGPSPPESRHPSVESTTSASANFANFARNGSASSLNGPVYRTPNYVRNSISTGCPTSMPAGSNWDHHKLSMIPPTPFEMPADPFDTSVPPMPEVPIIPAIPTMAAEPGEQGRTSLVVN